MDLVRPASCPPAFFHPSSRETRRSSPHSEKKPALSQHNILMEVLKIVTVAGALFGATLYSKTAFTGAAISGSLLAGLWLTKPNYPRADDLFEISFPKEERDSPTAEEWQVVSPATE